MWSDSNGSAGIPTLTAEPFHYRQSGEPNGNGSQADFETDVAGTQNGPGRFHEAQRQAFEQGRQQGDSQAKAAAQTELLAEREKVGQAIESFKDERAAYFAHIESEVVHLALAIARKILHREAQIDPLLLTGVVRVALEKLDSRTQV